ncbi:MAG TPA: hypothetical protein VGK99_11715 [Acidobacteriota bacterium]
MPAWQWHAALLSLALILIWAPPRFLTQDGPSHLYTCRVFSELLRSSNSAECVRIVTPPPPNSLCTWVGAALLPVAGAALTEKIWATLYVLLFAAGAAGLSNCFPQNSGLGAYILILNPFLFAGFWNFNLALGMFLLALAVIAQIRSAPSWYAPAVLVCLGTVLYATHLFVFATFLLALYLAILAGTAELRNRPVLLVLQILVLIMAPAGAVLFLWRQLAPLGTTVDQITRARLWLHFADFSPLSLNVWYRYGEQYVLLLIEVLLLVCFGYRAWRQRRFDFLAMVAAFLLCFLVVPDQLGVTMAIKGRLWLVAVTVAALWLPSRWNHAVGALCVILLLWHAWNILPRQIAWNRALAQLEEIAPRLEKAQFQASLMGIYWGRSTILPAVVPLLHADLFLAERSNGLSLSSNQLQSRAFAVQYEGACRESADALNALSLQETRSVPEIVAVVHRAGIRYLVLWKTGTLPWRELMQNEDWHVVHQTREFAVVDTGR